MAAGARERILVVEDDPPLGRMLQQLLQSFGYDVQHALRGEEALHLAAEHRPDLVLLDLILPDWDGYELCRVLRHRYHASIMPILIVTAKGQPVDPRSDLFSTGVVLYELLAGKKPFSGDNTHAIMHSVLSAEPERPSSQNPALPKAFDGILKKALCKDVGHRYQTAAEFREDLQSAVAPVAGKRNNLVLWSAMAVVILVLAIGGGMWFKLQRDQKMAQPGVETAAGGLSAEEQAKVERLMAVAEAHFKVGRLVSPQGSNAFEAYQLVLQVDPQHSAALDGINRVKNRFFKRAQLLALEGRQEDVEKHLALAQKLFPNDDRIMLLRNRVIEQ